MPEDAVTNVIWRCDRSLASRVLYRYVLLVPPGRSIKNAQHLSSLIVVIMQSTLESLIVVFMQLTISNCLGLVMEYSFQQ